MPKMESPDIQIGYTNSMVWAIAFACASMTFGAAWANHEKTVRYQACIEKFDHDTCAGTP